MSKEYPRMMIRSGNKNIGCNLGYLL
jgi:hypothetical protein